jgi:hypothetical protein
MHNSSHMIIVIEAPSLEVCVGKSRISLIRIAPALGCKAWMGKTFSSKMTSRDMYIRPVDTSRHFTPLCMGL